MRDPRTLALSSSWIFDRTLPWQRAVCLVLGGRAEVVEVYTENPIRLNDGNTYPRPAIIRFKSGAEGKRKRKTVRYSRDMLFVRDEGCCQYCAIPLNRKSATVDHVIPRAQGGRTSWDNVALACTECNHKKADRTPVEARMPLLRPHLVRVPNTDFMTRKNLETMINSEIPPEWEGWIS
jgi:5-methylcytosine-specific restriction endonuclease McrA